MSVDERPLDTLFRLAKREASGELISASARGEVHVYLQRGRVAWATDSEHPFAFTRHLQQTTQIDAASFRDILESCKRERLPLGETLVSWGVATLEEVRDALRHQLELALDVLRNGGPAQTLFLDRTRQFETYDSTLTFDLSEIAPDARLITERPTARPASSRAAVSSAPANVTRRLFESIDGAVWAALLDDFSVVESAPEPVPAERVPREAIERSLGDGAELVAVRSREGTLAGVALSGTRSLWCRLGRDATVGAAVSALSGYAGGPERRPADDGPKPPSRGATWTAGAAESAAASELRDFFSRAPETIAVFLTAMDQEPWFCGVGCDAVDAHSARELVQRRVSLLLLPHLFEQRAAEEAHDEDVGFKFLTVMSAERRLWCFGAELATKPRRALFVLLDRRASQGLGWAYLTSLSRQLFHVRGWERHG
jgi:hypothetical protein